MKNRGMPLQSGLEIKGFCTDKNLSIANKKINRFSVCQFYRQQIEGIIFRFLAIKFFHFIQTEAI